MKLESWHTAAEKARYRLIRRDYVDGGRVDGNIVAADEETGTVIVEKNGETKELFFGEHGISIVARLLALALILGSLSACSGQVSPGTVP